MSAMQGLTQKQDAQTEEAQLPLHEVRLGEDDVMVVLSDVHLGDVPGSDTDLCSFLSKLPSVLQDCLNREVIKPCQIHLVLNGDIVDYQLEAEDIALAAGAAFLRKHVAPWVNDKDGGMHVYYLIGNHEAGLHYLLEGMPKRVLVGRDHPWNDEMRQETASTLANQMQPYDTRERSRFGHGYLAVSFTERTEEGKKKAQQALIFHGDPLNHMIAIYHGCRIIHILTDPVRGLFRRLGWIPESPGLESSCEDIYGAFELWVASQDEETIGAANKLFDKDRAALGRLAVSFCGSRVALNILCSLVGHGGQKTDGGIGRRVVYAIVSLCLRGLRRVVLPVQWLLGLFGWVPSPKWRLGLAGGVAVIWAAVSLLFIVLSVPHGLGPVELLGLSLNAPGLLSMLITVGAFGYIWCRYLRCNRLAQMRANLRAVARWLLPLHNNCEDHTRLVRQCAMAPTPVGSYDWCLFGHFHDPRMEVERPQRPAAVPDESWMPRLVDVGSWRAPAPRKRKSDQKYNTFATISSGGVQLWQYGRTSPIPAEWK